MSPVDADAELAKICQVGWIDAAISEDSDLLAYGFPRAFFKMDTHGAGQSIRLPCLQP